MSCTVRVVHVLPEDERHLLVAVDVLEPVLHAALGRGLDHPEARVGEGLLELVAAAADAGLGWAVRVVVRDVDLVVFHGAVERREQPELQQVHRLAAHGRALVEDHHLRF